MARQIKGQMSLADYVPPPPIIHPVDIVGLCDDARCPRCNYCLDELTELDCKRCPVCGLWIDWAPWHRNNDMEVAAIDADRMFEREVEG